MAKGRLPLGTAKPNAALNEAAVIELRASVLSERKLAALFGVSRATIRAARDRRTWKHV
jgi:DNA invertase Pin-like site-specific DNA recombinase